MISIGTIVTFKRKSLLNGQLTEGIGEVINVNIDGSYEVKVRDTAFTVFHLTFTESEICPISNKQSYEN